MENKNGQITEIKRNVAQLLLACILAFFVVVLVSLGAAFALHDDNNDKPTKTPKDPKFISQTRVVFGSAPVERGTLNGTRMMRIFPVIFHILHLRNTRVEVSILSYP